MEDREMNRAVIAVCAIAFLTLVSSATSPALAVIGDNFPEASPEAIASIATLDTLTSVPFTIVTGLLLGRFVKFRVMTVLGLIISFIGGILPYFAANIGEILVGRAILGIGHGLIVPITNTLTLSLFKGDEVSKQFSRNSMATNCGAILFQLLGGFLGDLNWRLPFVVYVAIVPVLIITIICLPEPKYSVQTGLQKVKKFEIRKIFTGHVFFWAIVHALYMLWFYAYVTQTSGIIINNGYGNSSVSALVLSAFTLIGVFGGYSFHKIQKRIGTRTMTVGFFVNAASFIALSMCNNLASYTVFSLTFGFGYGLLQPAVNYFLGVGLDEDYRAACISVSAIISALGSFGSSYAVKYSKIILHTDWERIPFVVGSVFFLLLGILFIFFKEKKHIEKESI